MTRSTWAPFWRASLEQVPWSGRVQFPETGEESPYVGITDTFDATYVVAMQPDGSYVLTKVVKGTFVTRAGVSQPNPPTADCDTAASRQTGGVTGTFYGAMSVTVPANSGFNAFASCGAPCSPQAPPSRRRPPPRTTPSWLRSSGRERAAP